MSITNMNEYKRQWALNNKDKVTESRRKYQAKPEYKEKAKIYRARYNANPEHVAHKKEYMREWRKQNRERLNEYNRKWLEEHREWSREYQKAYRMKRKNNPYGMKRIIKKIFSLFK